VKPQTFKNLVSIVDANRRFHYEHCRAGAARAPWDYVVVTAANARQAEGYALELAARRSRGFFHEATEVIIAVDVREKRIGSGGATLNAVRAVAARANARGSPSISRERILVIHCGGSSMRIPHLAAVGKIFAAVPARLPGGVTSTVFDELFIAFAPLGSRMQSGLVVLSGDVLLAFPSHELDPNWKGVRGIGFLSSPELGAHHGVFVTDEAGRVVNFLQKAPDDELARLAESDPEGKIAVDSGVFMFDRAATKKLVKLAGVTRFDGSLFQKAIRNDVALDLYDDFARALVSSSAAPEDSIAGMLHRELSPLRFSANLFRDFAFVHMGTTRQFMDAWSGRDESARIFASDVQTCRVGPGLSWQGAANHALIDGSGRAATGSVVTDCVLRCRLDIGEGALVSGLRREEGTLRVPTDTVLCALPVRGENGREKWAVLVFGTDDNPKLTADEGGTFLGAPLNELPNKLGVSEDAIWPNGLPRNLWNAKLFAAAEKADPGLVEYLLDCETPRSGKWPPDERLSLADVFERADTPASADFRTRVRGETTAAIFAEDVRRGGDAEIVNILDGRVEPAAARYFIDAVKSIARRSNGLAAARLLAAAATTAASAARATEAEIHVFDGKELRAMVLGPEPIDPSAASDLESAALARVAEVVCAQESGNTEPRLPPCSAVAAHAPARLDFGGGWSDTPPYSLERGGTVLNLAIDLEGAPPVFTAARRLDEPVLRFISHDLTRTLEITSAAHLKTYANPADPFSVAKAAIALVMPELLEAKDMREVLSESGGCEIESRCRIPLGSGLGTSSIVAASLIASVARLRGIELERDRLFDLVLAAEQMITTGGGWQDQVGAVVPGLKLISTQPGIPQRVDIEPVALSDSTAGELAERLVLFYTGQTRKTKDLLREIMNGYLLRKVSTLHVLNRIKGIALEMRDALASGRLDDFGRLMLDHWELNKRMDPHSTTDHIEGLFRAAAPFMVGGKLAGAGGGGFLIAVAKSASNAGKLVQALSEQAAGRGGRPYSWDINHDGLALKAE